MIMVKLNGGFVMTIKWSGKTYRNAMESAEYLGRSEVYFHQKIKTLKDPATGMPLLTPHTLPGYTYPHYEQEELDRIKPLFPKGKRGR